MQSCWTFRGRERVRMRVFSADNLFEKRLLTEFDNLLRTYITVPQEDASQPWPGSEALVKASARPDGT